MTQTHTKSSSEIVPAEDVVIKDDAYVELLEEMNAIKVEFAYQRNISLCDQHWHWGKAIVEYQKEHNVGVSAFVRELHKDLGLAERSLWFAKRAADTYPTIDEWHNALPDGKATSWTKAKLLLGGNASEPSGDPDLKKVATGLIKRYGLDDAKAIAEIIMNTQLDTIQA